MELPETRFSENQELFLYSMPYTQVEGRPFFAWINGVEAAGEALMPITNNRCVIFNISKQAKQGDNTLAIYSNGGRIKGRIWITNTLPDQLPFHDPALSHQWLDWMNF